MIPRPGVRGSWSAPAPVPPITAEPQVLTIKDAAKALGISQTKLREAERSGEVPVIRVCGVPKVSTRWIREYIDGKTDEALAKGDRT